MKSFILCCLLFSSLSAADLLDPKELIVHEISKLNILIESTERSLGQEKQLREHMENYQKLHSLYLEEEENDQLLLQLVKTAHVILQTIKELRLETTFEPDFISELTVVSKPAVK